MAYFLEGGLIVAEILVENTPMWVHAAGFASIGAYYKWKALHKRDEIHNLNTMSSSSSSRKRNKNAVTPDKDVTASEKLEDPPKMTQAGVKVNSGQGVEHTYVHFDSASKFGRLGDPTKALIDQLFPVVDIRVTSYGTCLQGRATANTLVGPRMAYNDSTSIEYGLSRSVYCAPGQQKCVMYCHLGGGNDVVGAYKPPDNVTPTNNPCLSTGYTFAGLLANARDTVNISNTDNSFAPFTNSNSKYGFKNTMDYQGGYTMHEFVSTNNCEVVVNLQTARPKKFLGRLYDPMSLSHLSKINDVPYVGVKAAGQGAPSVTLVDPTNHMFDYSSSDDLLLHNYELSKNKRVVIPPGGSLYVKVNHPAFYFRETPFNMGLLNGSQLATGTTDVCYYPFCTVFLLMRIQGQTAADVALTSAVTTAINTVEVQLGHQQKEYHRVRGTMLSQPAPRIYIDQTNDTTADFIINDETDETMETRV